MNAALLAVQILSLKDENLRLSLAEYKENLKTKIVKEKEELTSVKYTFKTN
jgi:phosphoribosylcarboxyaminoimidazole (NCAIR) mutase